MSIESHKPAVQTRSTLSADRYGTKALARADATLLSTPGDFSTLMNSLSEDTSAIETVVPKSTIQTDVPLPLRTSTSPYAPSSTGEKGSEASQDESDLLTLLKNEGENGSEDTSVIDTALKDDTVGITNATDVPVQMGPATVLSAPENRFKPVAMSRATAETADSSPLSLSTHTLTSGKLAGMASGMLSVGDSAMPPSKHTPATQSGASFAQTLHDTRKSDVKTWSMPLADTFVQTAGMSEVLAGTGDRSTFKSSSKTETGLEGAFVSYFGPADSLNIDQQVTATVATVPDTAVAETVTYWATQGVQNAELKLDGFGDNPVEVSISMQGDQAQIEFRSDQPEVRLALENATTQLRDLLADQGLQLAGVSIGGSGRDSAHSNTPRQRTEGKKAVFVKTVATPVAAPNMRHVSVGRSLDVFA